MRKEGGSTCVRIPPAPDAGATGHHERLLAADGNVFTTYHADAAAPTGVGIIVLPDYGGLTPFYEALALRCAEAGIDAVALDYYGRTAGPPPRGTGFDHVDHARRSTWAGLQDDVRAVAAALRSERRVQDLFSIGFCYGGRASFLLSTLPDLAMRGVIGFYGWPVGAFVNDMLAPADLTDGMLAPVLGIFGGADDKIEPAAVTAFEASLRAGGVEHRLRVYEGAPHSFFDRRHAEHEASARDAWAEVLAFIEDHATARPEGS